MGASHLGYPTKLPQMGRTHQVSGITKQCSAAASLQFVSIPMITDEILTYVFDGQSHLLAESMATWLASSRRFADFVSTFRNKIRKKLRTTAEEENLLDLHLELETAYLLLQERRLSLEYEPLQAGGGRSPDYAVTYTTSMTFLLEVTRLRAGQKDTPTEAHPNAPRVDDRLADAICGKLGQLQPQQSNVLLVGNEACPLSHADLHATLISLQQRAEGDDEDFWRRYRFRNRAHFFRHYQRLSEILVRNPESPGVERAVAWVNGQAKYPLPSKVRTALYRSHAVA